MEFRVVTALAPANLERWRPAGPRSKQNDGEPHRGHFCLGKSILERFKSLKFSLAGWLMLLALVAHAAEPADKTGQLIEVLQSEAPLFEKARACQQLGETGSREAVPALAKLLGDAHLNAYARSGLEGIGGPQATAALREAAQKLEGPQLTGVIISLGVLQDTQSVALLGKFASDPTSGCADQALLALGNIATTDCIGLLRQTLTGGPAASRAASAAGCLLAADKLRARRELEPALELYDFIRKAEVPTAFRVGATRGAILAKTSDRVPFLIEQLRSEDPAIRDVALLTIREIPDDNLAAALNAELARTPVPWARQRQLLQALADCHNAQSVGAVQPFTADATPELRKTAFAVLGRIGSDAAPALIACLEASRAPEDRPLILAALRTMAGSAVDGLLIESLTSASAPAAKADLIGLLGDRGATKATALILKQTSAPDKQVTIAALSALKELASPQELPPLVSLAKLSNDKDVLDAAENALAGLCTRFGPLASEVVLNALEQATRPNERNVWIDVLAAAGYPKALPALEAATDDPNPEVAENALAQLGRWPDPAPIDTLLRAMEQPRSPALRQRALASVLDLAANAVDDAQRPESTIVQWLRQADRAAASTSDKRRILGVLGNLKTAASFRFLVSCLDNAELKTEAAAGVVQVAPALVGGVMDNELQDALEKVAGSEPNQALRERARQLAGTIHPQRPPVSLFDGRSLAGWEGDHAVWRVRDSLIVGGSLKGNPRNEFLATTRSYTNFVLHLEYKLVGTEGFINSGVQFRSVRMLHPPNEMNGYQADIGAGHSGCLYDESRRNKFLARCHDDTIKRLEKPGDWNQYELRCEGQRMQIWLNGEKTVDYSEPDSTLPQFGLIGLQIHGGNKAEVSFRNLAIQEL